MESEKTEKNGSQKALGRVISKSLSYLKVLIALLLVILVLVLVIDEFLGEKVVIDLIEVPKELSEKEFTKVAVTRQLLDAAVSFAHRGYNSKYTGNYPLKRLPSRPEDYENDKPDPNYRQARKIDSPQKARKFSGELTPRSEESSREIRAINGLKVEPLILSDSKQEPDIDLPTIGSVRAFVRYLKKKLSIPTNVHITGEITIPDKRKNYIRLVLRSSTSSALQPSSIQEGMIIDDVINKSGEPLLKLAYPCIAALSYYREETGTGSFAKTSQLIGSCRKDRKDVQYIADLLSALIAYEESPGQPKKAYKHFDAAIDSSPEGRKKGDVYFHYGRVLQGDNKPDKAKEKFSKAKEADPDNFRADIELAFIETGKSGVASTRKQLEKVLRRYPQRKPEIQVVFGNRLLDKKMPDDAIKEYGEAIDFKKNHVVAHNNLGIAHYYLGNYAEAIKVYEKAIKFDKDFTNAYYNWGIALNMLDEEDETKMLELISQYESALKKNSGSNIGYFLLGAAYLKIEKPQKAIKVFEEYDKRNTDRDFPVFYSQWGDALFQLAKQEESLGKREELRREAISKYEKALEIDSNYHLAYYKWGDALLQIAQQKNITYKDADKLREKAIKKYEKALEIDNKFHFAYYKIYIAYYILGESRPPNRSSPIKSLINKGDEYYKKWLAASTQYRLKPEQQSGFTSEFVSQHEPPVPQPPDRSSSGERLFGRILPLISALAVLLVGGLVIVIYNSKGKLRERFRPGPTKTPPSVPPVIPGEKATAPEDEDVSTDGDISSTPQSHTQVGGFPAKSPHRPAAILLGIKGTLNGRQFLVEKETYRIGADWKNDLSIPDDDYVSEKHAQLRYENGNLIIFDSGSRNGTFVNEERVLETGRVLFPGDRVQVGNTIFKVLAT